MKQLESGFDQLVRISDLPVSRRQLFQWGARVVGGIAVTGLGISAAERFLGKEQPYRLPGYLLKTVDVPVSVDSAQNWRKFYMVHAGDTISSIASQFYPRFNDNQPFYTDKLRFANGQDRQQNTLIYPGQTIYIPDPRIPTLGFAEGERVILTGQQVDGKDWPTMISAIDIKNKQMTVHYYNGYLSVPLEVGKEFATSRGLRIAAVLAGIPNLVPPRVVLDLI